MLDFVLQGHLKPSAVAKNLEAARGDYCLKNRSKDSTELIKKCQQNEFTEKYRLSNVFFLIFVLFYLIKFIWKLTPIWQSILSSLLLKE